MEGTTHELVPTARSVESKEKRESSEIMRRIVQRALELTDNPQTDIEPTDVLRRFENGGWDEDEYNRQLDRPQIYGGKEINSAVKLFWSHGGETSYIMLKDGGGNLVSVRHSKGFTSTASIEQAAQVDKEHEEIVIDILRENIVSSGKFGVAKKKEYFAEQILFGGIPGKGMDHRVSRGIQVRGISRKTYRNMKKVFATARSLSDLPLFAVSEGQEHVELDAESLTAIENVLQGGEIYPEGMIRAIVRKGGVLITSTEHEEKLRREEMFGTSQIKGS